MAIPTTRDQAATETALAGFLEATVPELSNVAVRVLSSPAGTGFSSDTVVFDAEHGPPGERRTAALVARVHPSGYSLYQQHDLDAQWRVIDAVFRSGAVPVPRIVAHADAADSPLGQPFFVMERAPGTAPADAPPYTVKGWLADAGADGQRSVYVQGLDAMAALHRLDWSSLGLDFLLRSTANPVGLDRQLRHDEDFARWVLGEREVEPLGDALRWLRAHRPAGEDLRLSWGDARLGNMLFHDLRLTAVLDWEMATLADPAADLGWWLVFNRIHTDGIGRPNLPGFPDDEEAVRLYEERLGRSVGPVRFYEVRAALRAALLLVKYTDALVAAGTSFEGARMRPYDPAIKVLGALLDA